MKTDKRPKQKDKDREKGNFKGKKQNKNFVGKLFVKGGGSGFVISPDLEDKISIESSKLNTGLHGDTVLACIHSKGKGEFFGEVLEVQRRSRYGFSGILEKTKNGFVVNPSDFKMYVKIEIPEKHLNKAKVGEKVFAVLDEWNDPKVPPTGIIKKVLGVDQEHEAEMEAIILERGFSQDFPKNVLAEARAIQKTGLEEKEYEKRKDVRTVTTFTIDPEDAKDFDDALSLEKNSDGTFEIGIHIADVSHYVKKGTDLDKEAYRRSTSVYLVDRTVPMLPEELSNDLCSLKPNVDRFAFSTILTLDKDGNIKKRWFGKTIINSDRRFSYEEAQNVLDNEKGEFFEELNILSGISKKLNKKRLENGSLILEQDEVKFVLDENKKPIRPYRKARFHTMKLIEEFMLLANVEVAKFCEGKDKSKKRFMIFRIHDAPTNEKLENLTAFVRGMGEKLFIDDKKQLVKKVNALIKKTPEGPLKDSISLAVIRSMQKAVYSTKNVGHFGLAFHSYTHFTSPIRRYPDLIVHRILEKYLEGKEIKSEQQRFIEAATEYTSSQEREAMDAERASIRFKQVEYLSTKVGEEMKGMISGVTRWGLYVEEADSKAEGMIKLNTIEDDYYEYREKGMEVVGEKTKNRFRLGDRVSFVVKNVDIDKRQVDFVLSKK